MNFSEVFGEAKQFYDQLTPQQLGKMHDYAQQSDPSALNRAMDHPDIQGALTQQGVTGWDGGQYPGQPGGRYGQDDPYQQDQGGY